MKRNLLEIISGSVRRTVAIVVAIGVYGWAIWFLLGGVGWAAALAVGLAVPVVLIPVALIWYMNVWGAWQLIRDARERQKRRAAVLAEAMAILAAARSGAAEVGEGIETDRIPCWQMTNCPQQIRQECPAYTNSSLPCWEMEGTFCKLSMEGSYANGRDTTACQTCRVYKKYGDGRPIRLGLVGAGMNTLRY